MLCTKKKKKIQNNIQNNVINRFFFNFYNLNTHHGCILIAFSLNLFKILVLT